MKTEPGSIAAVFPLPPSGKPYPGHEKPIRTGIKTVFFLVPVLAFVLFGANACARGQTGLVSAAASRKEPQVQAILERIMPGAMADGMVKIALLVNERDGGNTWQFIEAAVSEGRSMGFTVDAFAMDADAHPERFMEIAAGIAGADYDGLVFVNGDMGFAYDVLRPIADNGIRIVTFEALPFRDGRSIPGLVTTFQDDYSLARLSLETLISYTDDGTGRPPRVFLVTGQPGITFLDRHDWEFGEFVRMGKIVEAGRVGLYGLDNPRVSAWEAVSTVLPYFPPGSIDAFWVPWNEFAIGVVEALSMAGRHDVKMFSSGISNESLRLMQRHREIWLASTTVDHKLAGTVTMRILAAMLAGEPLDSTFFFHPQLVRTADLNRAVNVANLSMMLPQWDDGKGLFDHYQWMIELKAAETRFLRISPPGGPESASPGADPPGAGPARAVQ
ncbi:MAG: substrate-binding domain-containing protein [Treponema sp.]|nr:substrate-binding domain-containing protein [Treponema sp.]